MARYWPEFARHGKGDITVRMVLSHQAGLPVIDGAMSYDELLAVDPVAERLAGQTPIWEPGTNHGYHAFSYGFLLGEIVRRATGRRLGRLFADEVAGPLGLDFWIGLPPEHEGRVARLISAPVGGVVDELPQRSARTPRTSPAPSPTPRRWRTARCARWAPTSGTRR